MVLRAGPAAALAAAGCGAGCSAVLCALSGRASIGCRGRGMRLGARCQRFRPLALQALGSALGGDRGNGCGAHPQPWGRGGPGDERGRGAATAWLMPCRLPPSTRLRPPARLGCWRNGAQRPVLKHGPRSLTDVRVFGRVKPERAMKVTWAGSGPPLRGLQHCRPTRVGGFAAARVCVGARRTGPERW